MDMTDRIEHTLEEFEKGRLTRREATARVLAFVAAFAGIGNGARGNQESPSTFKALGLNHIALRVTDIPRSRDFYSRHLGLSVSRESSSSCFLDFGEDFLTLFRSSEAGLDHYCYAVEGYDVGSAAEKLRGQGLSGGRIYFNDPDGLEVQLAARGHRAE
ncbi:MAG: VOC family protein [Vicinamibacteria bacterium]